MKNRLESFEAFYRLFKRKGKNYIQDFVNQNPEYKQMLYKAICLEKEEFKLNKIPT